MAPPPPSPGDPTPSEKPTGRLPVELYSSIIAFLPRPSLPSAMRVNSVFYSSAARYLYSHLDVDLDSPNCPFIPTPKIILPQTTVTFPLVSHPSTSAPPYGVLALLPPRFSYTNHLSLVNHHSQACAKLSPLNMPNLISLRIRSKAAAGYHTLCHCPKSGRGAIKPCKKHTTCHCPLLANLRPSQLILGTIEYGLTGSAFVWPTSATSTPAFVEHLVIVVWAFAQLSDCRPFFAAIPSTVKRLTLVVQRFKSEDEMRAERVGEEEDEEDWTDEEDVLGFYEPLAPGEKDDFFKKLGLGTKSMVGTLWNHIMGLSIGSGAAGIEREIVGYDGLFRRASEKEVEAEIEQVRVSVQKHLAGRFGNDKEAEEKARAAKFWKGEEYLKEMGLEGSQVVRELVREAVVEGRNPL